MVTRSASAETLLFQASSIRYPTATSNQSSGARSGRAHRYHAEVHHSLLANKCWYSCCLDCWTFPVDWLELAHNLSYSPSLSCASTPHPGTQIEFCWSFGLIGRLLDRPNTWKHRCWGHWTLPCYFSVWSFSCLNVFSNFSDLGFTCPAGTACHSKCSSSDFLLWSPAGSLPIGGCSSKEQNSDAPMWQLWGHSIPSDRIQVAIFG